MNDRVEPKRQQVPLSNQILAAMAEIGALRTLIIHAIALRVLEEPDPFSALNVIEGQLTSSPTVPDEVGSDLDPAMSDLLAALTDERIEHLMRDLRQRLASFAAPS